MSHLRLVTIFCFLCVLFITVFEKVKVNDAVAATPIEQKEGTGAFDYLRQACGDEEKCMCVNDVIFTYDSHWATQGQGARNNNPCNVRPMGDKSPYPSTVVPDTMIKGSYFSRFGDLKTGIFACVDLYARVYSKASAVNLVSTWAQSPLGSNYHSAMTKCFKK